MKKRKTVEDPEEEHQQHEEEEHDASTLVNGTRHKLQPDKLRQHKEEAERKGTDEFGAIMQAHTHNNRHRVHQPHPTTHGTSCGHVAHLHHAANAPTQKPAKLRHLLEKHGTVTRIYCAPEGVCVLTHRHKPQPPLHRLSTHRHGTASQAQAQQ